MGKAVKHSTERQPGGSSTSSSCSSSILPWQLYINTTYLCALGSKTISTPFFRCLAFLT